MSHLLSGNALIFHSFLNIEILSLEITSQLWKNEHVSGNFLILSLVHQGKAIKELPFGLQINFSLALIVTR